MKDQDGHWVYCWLMLGRKNGLMWRQQQQHLRGGTTPLIFYLFILFLFFGSVSFVLFVASGLLAFVCRCCRIQYNGMSLHCLLCFYCITIIIIVSLYRSFMATGLVISLGGRIGTDTGCAGCWRVERTCSGIEMSVGDRDRDRDRLRKDRSSPRLSGSKIGTIRHRSRSLIEIAKIAISISIFDLFAISISIFDLFLPARITPPHYTWKPSFLPRSNNAFSRRLLRLQVPLLQNRVYLRCTRNVS